MVTHKLKRVYQENRKRGWHVFVSKCGFESVWDSSRTTDDYKLVTCKRCRKAEEKK